MLLIWRCSVVVLVAGVGMFAQWQSKPVVSLPNLGEGEVLAAYAKPSGELSILSSQGEWFRWKSGLKGWERAVVDCPGLGPTGPLQNQLHAKSEEDLFFTPRLAVEFNEDGVVGCKEWPAVLKAKGEITAAARLPGSRDYIVAVSSLSAPMVKPPDLPNRCVWMDGDRFRVWEASLFVLAGDGRLIPWKTDPNYLACEWTGMVGIANEMAIGVNETGLASVLTPEGSVSIKFPQTKASGGTQEISGPESMTFVKVFDDQVIAASRSGNVFVSSRDLNSWRALPVGAVLKNLGFTPFWQDIESPARGFWVALASGRLLVSRNAGLSWTVHDDFEGRAAALARNLNRATLYFVSDGWVWKAYQKQ